jgi:epoxyqueuosine reductase
MEAWYFGCDLCQTVCPWNQHLFKAEMKKELETPPATKELENEILLILKATPEELKKMFDKTPLLRAKPWAHKRNAILVAVHYGLSSLKEDIAALKTDENLTTLVDWALKSI